MREKIILAPGANGDELKKSLAMHGSNCFNLRICGAGELARLAMMRSGISVTGEFISAGEETAIVAEAVKGEAYFGKATYSDLREITMAIRRMRSLVAEFDEVKAVTDILRKGLFKEKNDALISVYRKYMAILSDRKLTDSVSLIRRAAYECQPIDADFYYLKEYPLNPLERSLLNRVSFGNAQEGTISGLFGLKGESVRVKCFRNCYGAANEAETILTEIYSSHSIDTCTVAETDAVTYGQLFFDYAVLYDIPVSFGCGIPVINSNPAKLLELYYHWMTGGFFGAASVKALLLSEVFDREKLMSLYPERSNDFSWSVFYDVVGAIRLTNDRTVNSERLAGFVKAVSDEEARISPGDEKAGKTVMQKKLCIPFLEVLARELSLPPEEFIAKYSVIRKGTETNTQRLIMNLDMAASRAIYDELKVIGSSVDRDTEDIISSVMKMSVRTGRNEPGKLYVTGIDGALSSIREHLYIAGLSASRYPGSPRENYLLLDADLKLFGEGAEHMTSDGHIARKRERLLTLARLATGLGSSVEVSFAGLNVSELKHENASSLVFELYREDIGRNLAEKNLEEHIIKIGYFEPAISSARNIGKAYNEGKTISANMTTARRAAAVSWNPDREYSPSALDTFFSCPRSFMLKYIFGLPVPDDDKPFEVMAANESGTLAHALMEELANTDMSKGEFMRLSEDFFDRFIAVHPPLVPRNVQIEKDAFLEMMETAYDMDPHREVILKEEDIHCLHESGVKIHGFPDRVEKLDAGSYLIVDFKSGRSIVHEQDDIESCLQVIVYAYMMEQKGYRISGAEYRYIRLGETVSCKYDDEMKEKLLGKLKEFKKHLDASDYPLPSVGEDDNDPCRFCKYATVCGRDEEIGG